MKKQTMALGPGTIGLLLPVLAACGAADGQAHDEFAEDELVGEVNGALHTTTLLSTASPTVCFVKAAMPTNFAIWVDEIQTTMTQWEAASGLDFQFQGECGPAGAGGVFPGDIRIFVNENFELMDGTIPGCTQVLGGPNSGGFPGTYSNKCKYNASFFVDQPINNYLHESGHTIGFLHEHVRTATPASCLAEIDEAPGNGTLLTPYDRFSVMHYGPNVVCDSPGNGSETGLSHYDALGVEISYPKSTQIPIAALGGMAFGGGFAFRTDSGGGVTPEWTARGALAGVFTNFKWTIGSSVTTNLLRPISGSLGSAPVTATMTFADPWSRSRSGSRQIWTDSAKHASVVMAAL